MRQSSRLVSKGIQTGSRRHPMNSRNLRILICRKVISCAGQDGEKSKRNCMKKLHAGFFSFLNSLGNEKEQFPLAEK
jgi:hypothetical protein